MPTDRELVASLAARIAGGYRAPSLTNDDLFTKGSCAGFKRHVVEDALNLGNGASILYLVSGIFMAKADRKIRWAVDYEDAAYYLDLVLVPGVEPRPGDAAFYRFKNVPEGHVGLVTRFNGELSLLESSTEKRGTLIHGKAVRVTPLSWFGDPATFAAVTREALEERPAWLPGFDLVDRAPVKPARINAEVVSIDRARKVVNYR